jgi:hypothetical protein
MGLLNPFDKKYSWALFTFNDGDTSKRYSMMCFLHPEDKQVIPVVISGGHRFTINLDYAKFAHER